VWQGDTFAAYREGGEEKALPLLLTGGKAGAILLLR